MSAASLTGFARLVSSLIAGVLCLLPAVIAVYAFAFSEEIASHPDVVSPAVSPAVSPGPLPLVWQASAFGVLLLVVSPMLYALWSARRLFGGYAAGEVFTIQSARRLKGIAVGLFGAAAAGPLGSVALSLVLSAAGQAHGIALTVGSNQLWFALFGLIMWGIARVMGEAATLAEDHASIV